MQADIADAVGLRRAVHQHLLATLEPAVEVGKTDVRQALSELAPLLDQATFDGIVDDVLSDIHGLGVLEELMSDPGVTDVLVVGGRGTWIERDGKVVETTHLLGDDEIVRLIERVIAPLGQRIDRSSPMVDARLPDGSRLNAVVPPVAVDGPCLTIRRFGARQIDLGEITTPEIAQLLAEAVDARMNIVISGGTGSGKTTLLNAMCAYVGPEERLITVEDAAELRLPIHHVVRLEARPANTEGTGDVGLRALVRNALRMRPDRIIVGEVRGPEALDMLQAMNTGHAGSMSTCHANSCFDALRRVETMVLMGATELPLGAVRQQIVSSIDLVVQIARDDDGVRKVVSVCDVIDDDGVASVREIANEFRIYRDSLRPSRR